MNLYYFTPTDIQVARVDRQCIVKFCEALSDFADTLKLVSIQIQVSEHERAAAQQELYALYGVRPSFDITLLPTRIHQDRRSRWDALTTLMVYAGYSGREFLIDRRAENPVIYLKNYAYMIPFILINRLRAEQLKLVFEIHSPPTKAYQKRLLRFADGIVVNSHALKKDLEALGHLEGKRALGIHQGVDLTYVDSIRVTRNEARARLDLPQDEFIAIYTGKVSDTYPEIDYYIEAAERLQGQATIIVVGGRADRVAKIRRRTNHLQNLRFVEFVPPAEVFYYQFAADALMLYYPPGIKLNKYRSPGKLFEYMASGSPIVCADYPVLKEVVTHGETALMVERDNPDALVEGILRLKNDPDLGSRIAQNARREVEQYTWPARASRINEFIGTL